MKKQPESTRRIKKPISTHKTNSKGGSVTITDSIMRQSHVEKYMKLGYGVTQIAAIIVNGKKLGALETISRDITIIYSRWLESDLDWFHRASIARIEAKERLMGQLVRLGELIVIFKKDKNKQKTLVSTEGRLTTVITKLYEIDADFDPEQYIDKRIQESLDAKIKKGSPTIS